LAIYIKEKEMKFVKLMDEQQGFIKAPSGTNNFY